MQEREVLTGYVSVICDLGTQELEDAEMPFTGTPEEEAEAIAKFPNTYFKDGYDFQTKKNCRMKCWPQKPQQSVAVAVDFPDIIVDKGKFFGESNPLPLRLWLGGQFYDGSSMVVGRPTALKVNKKLGDWSFDKKHLFHKMAVAAKLIGTNECFLPQRIGELLGKSFQFNTQVYMKPSKGKEYYTEYVTFSSGLGRGQQECELLTEPQLIQFFQPNKPEAIKELRAHVVNTAKKALNYDKSVFKSQVEELRGGNTSTPDKAPSESEQNVVKESPTTPTDVEEVVAEKPASNPDFSDFDDDIPF